MPGRTFRLTQAVGEAAERARAGNGPTLIEAVTFRMGGHSTSDDPTAYVPEEEVAAWKDKDPIDRFERYLIGRDLLDPAEPDLIYDDCLKQVDAASKAAQGEGQPALETIFSDVYATLPTHLRQQGEAAFELASRLGEAAAGDGAFPL